MKNLDQYPTYHSRPRALARALRLSRDKWKEKYQAVRKQIQAFRERIRDLQASRQAWREKAQQASDKLQQQNQEIEDLRKKLQHGQQEIQQKKTT